MVDVGDAVSTDRAADWYEHPDDPTRYRYWDGNEWTEHTAPREGEPSADAEEVHGAFGDGISRPLYEFQASRLKGGRMFTPNVIRIWPDRIEEHAQHAIRKTGTKAINFARVAQVAVKRGLVWTDIAVESTGGHTITLVGLPKQEADRDKDKVKVLREIRDRMGPDKDKFLKEISQKLG